MSVQETYLKAIADAIRQKEESQGAIPAKEFAGRILALETGGGTPPASGGMEILSGWQEDRQTFTGPVKMPGVALVVMDSGLEILEGY